MRPVRGIGSPLRLTCALDLGLSTLQLFGTIIVAEDSGLDTAGATQTPQRLNDAELKAERLYRTGGA